MELNVLPPLSLPSFAHDALAIAGVAVALIACLAFVTLGVLLPGVLTALGGSASDRREGYVDSGPVAHPVISKSAPRREAHSEPPRDQVPRQTARPRPWRFLSGSTVSPLVPPARPITR